MMRLIFIIAGLAAALSVMPSAQALQLVRATCPSNHTAVATSDGLLMANSTAFITVAETSVRFVQGGNRPECVVVTLSAEAAAPPTQELLVRALLDGEECAPGEVTLARGDASAVARVVRAMSFLCTDVGPGVHRIKMQYRSSSNAAGVALHARTMTVHYFK